MKRLIKGATLLSINEAKQVPESVREFKDWWWLRSPGFNTYDAAYVDHDGRVSENGDGVCYDDYSVRPALQLNPLSKLTDGAKLTVGDYTFTIICDGKYALCDTPIGQSAFREDENANDANVYETSDIRKFIDEWYETKIEGQKYHIAD